MNSRTLLSVFFVLTMMMSSCRDKGKSKNVKAISQTNIHPRKDYLSLIISMDTLSSEDYKNAVHREYSLFIKAGDTTTNPFYHHFKARKYNLEKHRDSAMTEFKKMVVNPKDMETIRLKNYDILSQSIVYGSVIESDLMNRILSAMQHAERSKSKITYQFYDLVARAYYQNQNHRAAMEYTERYYQNHPYQSHAVVRQRYYDISFLLASQVNDYDKMKLYNLKARELAEHIGDSMAIARSFDYEAQIYSKQGQNDKVLASSRIYFNYLKKTNSLNDVAYNNLAASFIRATQPDSAIHYYKEGIDFIRHKARNSQSPSLYTGISEAYRMKGDYVSSLAFLDSAYTLRIMNLKEIEAVKIAEIQEKYQTEKKDRNIAELSNRNKLNEKIIQQQRWTLVLALLVFLGLLGFFYVIHRQYRLKEKNKLLQLENSRLNIEQKLLQSQLNPHFIFNAIANLQGLIATGDTKESVRYLSAFSGLLRSILEQNRKDFISLEEERASLENYLQLQQMRFAGLFDYKITVDEKLLPEYTLIPPMLIQPFV
jgi:hypothetical protein